MDIFKSVRGLFFLSFLVIFGSFIFYHFSVGNYVISSYGILISFVIYIAYTIYVSIKKIKRQPIEILTETIAVFSVFLFPLLAYGFVLFENSIEGVLLLVIFSFMQILNFVKNWAYEVQHSKGFPIVLHGLFFPLIVFISQIIAPNFEQALFIVYFIITSMLSVTPYNFIQYQGGLFEEERKNNNNDENTISHNSSTFKENIQTINDDKQNEQITNEDNLLLNSIPYLNKDSMNPQNEQMSEFEFDDDSIDEEDEKFFNSLEKFK
ncbi:MAG: hypothetical protein ACMXYB_00140 [Candidatus Woesearchaeota archaeon]